MMKSKNTAQLFKISKSVSHSLVRLLAFFLCFFLNFQPLSAAQLSSDLKSTFFVGAFFDIPSSQDNQLTSV